MVCWLLAFVCIVQRRRERNDVDQSPLFSRPRWKSTLVGCSGSIRLLIGQFPPPEFPIGRRFCQSVPMSIWSPCLAVDWSIVLKRCTMIAEFFSPTTHQFDFSPAFRTMDVSIGPLLKSQESAERWLLCRQIWKVSTHEPTHSIFCLSALSPHRWVSNYKQRRLMWRCENHAATPPFYI